MHLEAQEKYAAMSWQSIVSSGCAVEDGTDTTVVQAISLVAIIDFAGTRSIRAPLILIKDFF
jgi:hypothetical protein